MSDDEEYELTPLLNRTSEEEEVINSNNSNDRSQSQTTATATTIQQESGNYPEEPTTTAQMSAAAEEDEKEHEMIYGARHVIMLFVPVAICMTVVVITISSVTFYSRDDGTYLLYTPFHPESDDTTGDTLLKSLGNALIILTVVIIMTFMLVLCFKFRCYKFIHGWLMFSSVMLLFLFSFLYAQEVFKAYNIPVDLLSTMFCLWNFGMTGMFIVHWKGPLRLQQSYLIVISALMALIFIKYMPEWTLWTVLALISVWDLVAVLAPKGPLRMLVEIASERNESIFPALIYSSTVMYFYMVKHSNADSAAENNAEVGAAGQKSNTAGQPEREDKSKFQGYSSVTKKTGKSSNKKGAVTTGQGTRFTGTSASESATAPPTEPEQVHLTEDSHGQAQSSWVVETNTRYASRGIRDEAVDEGEQAAESETEFTPAERSSEDTERGVKLGLGDFIFYSVLVGKASSYGDMNTTIACFISILMGLFTTLAILATVKKALPALPISITFGLVFYFGTRYSITPFATHYAQAQVFI